MRARNIKPGYYKDASLLECEPLARILFSGLWCLADREGRVKDNPKQIKIEILPMDECDVDALLQQLADKGKVIVRYECNGTRILQVLNFKRHQKPHANEPVSELPSLEQALATKVTSTSHQSTKDSEKNPSTNEQSGKVTACNTSQFQNTTTNFGSSGKESEKIPSTCDQGTKDSDQSNKHFALNAELLNAESLSSEGETKKLENEKPDPLKANAMAKRVSDGYCREVGGKGSRSHGIDSILKILDEYPRTTESDLERAAANYRAKCERDNTRRDYRLGVGKFFAGEWQHYLDESSRAPPMPSEQSFEEEAKETQRRLAAKRSASNARSPADSAV